MAAFYRLTGRTRHYAWGDPETIPAFAGFPSDGRPVAEVWFGAHPDAPAFASEIIGPVEGDASPAASAAPTVDDLTPVPLDALTAAQPDSVLGSRVAERFGSRLPYLVKLLCAARPLSLQVHPTVAQAQEGYAREEAAGLPRAQRTYLDRNHKPETLLALTPMRALAGFRAPEQIAQDLTLLGEALPAAISAALQDSAAAPAERLRAAFTQVLHLSADEVARAIAALENMAPQAPGAPWGTSSVDVARELAAACPGDRGVLAAMFLQPHLLAPGAALNVGAGEIHCYIAGFGIEVMASSDNVVRAGLTPKPVNVEELLRIVDFRPVSLPQPPTQGAPATLAGVKRSGHSSPVPDYQVAVYSIDIADARPAELSETEGPRLLVGLSGAVDVRGETAAAALSAGQAILITDAAAAVNVRGRGQFAVIAVPNRDEQRG